MTHRNIPEMGLQKTDPVDHSRVQKNFCSTLSERLYDVFTILRTKPYTVSKLRHTLIQLLLSGIKISNMTGTCGEADLFANKKSGGRARLYVPSSSIKNGQVSGGPFLSERHHIPPMLQTVKTVQHGPVKPFGDGWLTPGEADGACPYIFHSSFYSFPVIGFCGPINIMPYVRQSDGSCLWLWLPPADRQPSESHSFHTLILR